MWMRVNGPGRGGWDDKSGEHRVGGSAFGVKIPAVTCEKEGEIEILRGRHSYKVPVDLSGLNTIVPALQMPTGVGRKEGSVTVCRA